MAISELLIPFVDNIIMRLALTIIVLLGVFCSAVHAQQPASPEATGAKQEQAADYVTKAGEAEKRLDFSDALRCYEKAAELGDARSMYELGWYYFGAHDIPGRHFGDYPKAAIWFQKAASLNYVPALTQLGVMYNSDGSLGVPEDHAEAAQLYMKAAQAGDAQAMNNLGLMYGRGQGVPQDIAKALYWWRKAVKVDKDGSSGKAAQSWLDLHDGKPLFPRWPGQ